MEMLELLRALPRNRYAKRSYVVANTDHTSEVKARTSGILVEEEEQNNDNNNNENKAKRKNQNHVFYTLPRAREVGQSYITAIWTTFVAFIASFRIILSVKPDLLLVNGPGTCLPLCIAAWIVRNISMMLCCSCCFGRGRSRGRRRSGCCCCFPYTKIVFVESVCRVKKLSMTGRILYTLRIADAVHVQWQQLKDAYPRTDYVGIVL